MVWYIGLRTKLVWGARRWRSFEGKLGASARVRVGVCLGSGVRGVEHSLSSTLIDHRKEIRFDPNEITTLHFYLE